MTATELFARMPSAHTGEIFAWLHENDRAAYKTCTGLLATRRKLRPVFVERKPREERHVWMKENLARPANGDLAAEILQAWILGANRPMVCAFLDALAVPHDGKGLIENLPPEPAGESVRSAVEALLRDHPQMAVMAYLNIFSGMEEEAWPVLKSLVSTDPRLCPEIPTQK